MYNLRDLPIVPLTVYELNLNFFNSFQIKTVTQLTGQKSISTGINKRCTPSSFHSPGVTSVRGHQGGRLRTGGSWGAGGRYTLGHLALFSLWDVRDLQALLRPPGPRKSRKWVQAGRGGRGPPSWERRGRSAQA